MHESPLELSIILMCKTNYVKKNYTIRFVSSMMLLEARNIILCVCGGVGEEKVKKKWSLLRKNVPEFLHFIPEYRSGYKCIPSTQNIDTSVKQNIVLIQC